MSGRGVGAAKRKDEKDEKEKEKDEKDEVMVGQSNHEAEGDAYVMDLSCICPDLSCLGLACHSFSRPQHADAT